ncbi:MAG: hypothetical protein Q9160_001192 [Pyrenula sp. 1 TL-2023]
MAAKNDALPRTITNNQGRHIPAWKRIGLRLKHAKDTTESFEGSPGIEGATSITRERENPFEGGHLEKRRKVDISTNRPRPASHGSDAIENVKVNGEAKPKKQVTFREDNLRVSTPQNAHGTAVDPEDTAKSSYAADTAQQQKKLNHPQPSSQKSHASLAYLDQYHTSRDSWKFNKNKEIWLLNNALSIELIPSSYNPAYSNYLKGLKGGQAKAKLRANAETAINQDKTTKIEAPVSENSAKRLHVKAGATGKAILFPMDDPVTCKEAYEAEIRRYKRRIEECLEAEDEELDAEDPKLQTRLAKRKRAELLLWSLGPYESASESVTRALPHDRSHNDSITTSPDTVSSNTRKVKQLRKVRTTEMDHLSGSSDDEDGNVSHETIYARTVHSGADSTSPSQTDSSSRSGTDSSTLRETETEMDAESYSDGASASEIGSETSGISKDVEVSSSSSSSSSDETEEVLL